MLLRVNLGQYPTDLHVEPTSEKTLKLTFRFNRDLIDEIKAMKGARWWPDKKCWTVEDCKRNWFNLDILSGKPFIYDAKLPTLDLPGLRKNQNENVAAGRTFNRIIIADEMGLGKTLSALRIIEENMAYTWVVCPKTAKYSWEKEITKWSKFEIGFGPGKIKLITYDAMTDLTLKLTPDKTPVNVIFDEMHKLKNPKAQRTQAAFLLTEYAKGKVIGLTGTPNPKDPSDWWALTEAICPGFLREGSKQKLIKRLAVTSDQGSYFKIESWKEEEVKKLYRRLKGLVQIHFKKDCLDIPPKNYIRQEFEVSAETKSLFNFIKKSATNALEALNKCRQFSDGFQYDNEEVQLWTPKDEALADDLEELEENNQNRIVIFGGFSATVDKIVKIVKDRKWSYVKLDGRGVEAEVWVEEWQKWKTVEGRELLNEFDPALTKSERRIAFIGQPDAGGLSLNLQKAQLTIFYSNSFKGASRWQAEDRIHRIGTTSATIKDYLWLPTDLYVLENLQCKRDLQALTLGEIQALGETK